MTTSDYRTITFVYEERDIENREAICIGFQKRFAVKTANWKKFEDVDNEMENEIKIEEFKAMDTNTQAQCLVG